LDTAVLTLSFLQYGYDLLSDDDGPSILKGGRPSDRRGILDRLRGRSFFFPSFRVGLIILLLLSSLPLLFIYLLTLWILGLDLMLLSCSGFCFHN